MTEQQLIIFVLTSFIVLAALAVVLFIEAMGKESTGNE